MPGAEIQANAIETVLRGLPLTLVPRWLDLVLIVAARLPVAARQPAPEPLSHAHARDRGSRRLPRRHADRVRPRLGRSRSSTRWARSSRRRRRDRCRTTCSTARSSASVSATCSRASCPRTSSTRSSPAPTRDLRLGGVSARGHGDVHRPARLHDLLRGAAPGPRDRVPEPLPRAR